MTDNAYKAALPWGGDNDLLRTALVARTLYQILPGELASDLIVLDTESGAILPGLLYNQKIFWLDEESTADEDLETVLVSGDDYRYVVDTLSYDIRSVKSRALADPPADPALGDTYVVANGPTGDWAALQDAKVIFTPRGWIGIAPRVGDWVHVADEDIFIRYVEDGEWRVGPGFGTVEEQSLPMSAAINFGRFVLVENQTLEDPPGWRIVDATPTNPHGGGDATPVNDNDPDTILTTSALGSLSSADGFKRVAVLDFGAIKAITAIRARGMAVSAGASLPSGGTLRTSDDGVTWTQVGAGFTINTTPREIIRNDDISCRYVAFCIEDLTAWNTTTAEIADLNAYEENAIDASPPAAWVIGENPIGPLSGHSGKIAVVEQEGAFTIYDPPDGSMIFDRDIQKNYQYRDGVWKVASGKSRQIVTVYSASDTHVKDPEAFQIKIECVGAGGGNTSGATVGGDTFVAGNIVRAKGGTKTATAQAAGNIGDQVIFGELGLIPFGDELVQGGSAGGPYQGFGRGAWNRGLGAAPIIGGGNGGSYAMGIFDADDVATNLVITIGAAATGNVNGGTAQGGYCVITEDIEA